MMYDVCSLTHKVLARCQLAHREVAWWGLTDGLVLLTSYDPRIQAYVPCTKDWIKKRCFSHLKRQAT